MLQINGISFNKIDFGEQAILLQPINLNQVSPIHISKTAESIYELDLVEIKEVITGIEDICIVFENKTAFDFKKLANISMTTPALKLKLLELEVDFNQGLDWDSLEKHTKLSKTQCIELLISAPFQFQMSGFIPGFVYLQGLPPILEVPRKSAPRRKVEAGSIGIGGKQFGIYNIASPGGWNIIGKTKHPLFNKSKIPPLDLKVGDQIKLVSV